MLYALAWATSDYLSQEEPLQFGTKATRAFSGVNFVWTSAAGGLAAWFIASKMIGLSPEVVRDILCVPPSFLFFLFLFWRIRFSLFIRL